ncbi:MAG: substrate-binding periplasmic protein [Methyloligellaceae bacterium]
MYKGYRTPKVVPHAHDHERQVTPDAGFAMTDISRRTLVAGLAASASIGFVPSVQAKNELGSLAIMTEDYPPFNYRDGNQLHGMSVDIMMEICKRAKTGHQRSDIALLPWARGYNLTLKRSGHALFSTTRTEQREPLFKWVGPFVPTIVGLTAHKDRKLKIQSLDDLSRLRIGVVKDDVGQLQLQAKGVPDDRLEAVLTNEQNYRKLMAGRVDAICYETEVTKWGLRQLGANPADYEIVYELTQGNLYLALHRQTPNGVVVTLQDAFDSLVSDGSHQRIIASYSGAQ